MRKIELKAEEGASQGKVFDFNNNFPVIIGRALDSNIKIPEDDPLVSRYHCIIDYRDGQLLIRDSGSANGTYVNGCTIADKKPSCLLPVLQKAENGEFPWIILNDGDEITVGESLFSVHIHPELCAADEYTETDTRTVPTTFDPNHLHKIDHYRIIKKIGSGGAGDIFQVKDTRSGDIIALKMLKYTVQRKERELKQFLREIDILKRLKHPNIIRFIDTGNKSGIYYFTTDYCNNGSLIDWLDTKNRLLTIDEAMPIIYQVLDALEYAHLFNIEDGTATSPDPLFTGLVHRDIKPGNILLHNDDNRLIVKVADFGLSKIRSGGSSVGMLTKTGTVGGTVEFLSKQQMIDYKHARGAVDLWSTMAVLYYMLTSEPPREFEEKVPPYKTVLTTKPVPIKKHLPDFPDKLAEIIDLALDDSVSLHYKTASQLKNDLKDITKQL